MKGLYSSSFANRLQRSKALEQHNSPIRLLAPKAQRLVRHAVEAVASYPTDKRMLAFACPERLPSSRRKARDRASHAQEALPSRVYCKRAQGLIESRSAADVRHIRRMDSTVLRLVTPGDVQFTG